MAPALKPTTRLGCVLRDTLARIPHGLRTVHGDRLHDHQLSALASALAFTHLGGETVRDGLQLADDTFGLRFAPDDEATIELAAKIALDEHLASV